MFENDIPYIVNFKTKVVKKISQLSFENDLKQSRKSIGRKFAKTMKMCSYTCTQWMQYVQDTDECLICYSNCNK